MCDCYDKSVESCDEAEKSKSLCDVLMDLKSGKKSKDISRSISFSSGIWCIHDDCDKRRNNKREGSGRAPIIV
jgi:hypothetical protein